MALNRPVTGSRLKYRAATRRAHLAHAHAQLAEGSGPLLLTPPPGADPLRALVFFADAPIGIMGCGFGGCTTCGGHARWEVMNRWVEASLDPRPDRAARQIARTLTGLARRREQLALSLLDACLGTAERPFGLPNALSNDVRAHPRIATALSVIDRRASRQRPGSPVKERRDRARRAPARRAAHAARARPETEEERLARTAQREEETRLRTERARLHRLQNDPRWIKAYREARRARNAAAHAERLLAKVEREIADRRLSPSTGDGRGLED